ncbi:MAG: hypothetical protein ACJAVG_000196 [Rickettsiales bacterium]|jgi:hypothetical protein
MDYKKPIRIISIAVLAIIALLFIVPFSINGDGLKSQLETKVSQKLEAKFEIRGRVRAAIVPFPKIFLDDVEISNLKLGSDYSSDVVVETISIRTNFASLFGGKIKIVDLVFSKPIIKTKDVQQEEKKFQPKPLTASNNNILNRLFSFGKNDQVFDFKNIKAVEFVDGVFSKINSKDKVSIKFDEINFALNNNERKQILEVDGYFVSDKEPANFSLIADTRNNKKSLIKIQSAIFAATLEGKFLNSRIDDLVKSNFIGQADIKVVDLKTFLNKYISKDSQIFRKISATKPINIVADIENNSGKIDIKNIIIESKLMSGQGNAIADFSDIKTKISAKIDFNNIDIDGIWSPATAGNSNFLDLENQIVQNFISNTTFLDKDDDKTYILDVKEGVLEDANPDGFDFNAEIKIKNAKYYGDDLSDIRINFITSSDNILLESLSANIPGEGSILVSGIVGQENKIPQFVGNIKIVGGNLQEAFSWIGVDLDNLAPNILSEYSFQSDLLLLPRFSVFNNLNLAINDDKNLVTGSLKIDDSVGFSKISADLKMDYLNFDDYFSQKQKNPYLSKGSLLQKLLWLNEIKYDQDIVLNVEKFIFQDHEMENSGLRMKFGQGYFTLSDLNLSSPRINLSGQIGVDITKLPVLNIDILSNGLDFKDPQIADRFFDLPDISDFSGAINFDIKSLKINDWQAQNIKINGGNILGIVDFEQFELEPYMGSAKFKGSMIFKDLKTVNGSVQLIGVDSGLVLLDIMGIDNIKGASNISAVVNSSASNKEIFIRNLDIRGQFIGSNIEVGGFGIYDLAMKTARPKDYYAELQTPVNILQNSETFSNFTNVSGSFIVSKGSRADQFSIKTVSAGINSVVSGSFDIGSGIIDGTSDLIFLSGTREIQIPIRIAVSFKGKSGNIKQVGNFTQISQYLKQRFGDDYVVEESPLIDSVEQIQIIEEITQ